VRIITCNTRRSRIQLSNLKWNKLR